MDQNSLVSEEMEAGAEFVRSFNSFMPVNAAFWVKQVDDHNWTLCIVSQKINDESFDRGYGEVLRLADEMKNPYLDPFQIKLIRYGDPASVAAEEIHQKYPSKLAVRFGGKEFGDMPVEGVYIYPVSIVGQCC